MAKASGPTNNRITPRPSRWQRIKAQVHRRDVWLALIFTTVGLFLSALLFPSDYGALGYRNSVIKVFDAKSVPGGLRLLDDQNQPILSDVYAVETILANTGTLPFDQSRVRRPVEIKFGGAKVIQTRISGAVDDDVSHFNLERTSDDTVSIGWASFDPGQHLTVTTLVAASAPVEAQITGSIFGVKISVGRPPSALGPLDYMFGTILVGAVVLGSAFLGGVMILGALRNLRTWRDWLAKEFFLTLLAIALGIFFFCLAGGSAYFAYTNFQKPIMPL